jgi:hypothetical protein
MPGGCLLPGFRGSRTGSRYPRVTVTKSSMRCSQTFPPLEEYPEMVLWTRSLFRQGFSEPTTTVPSGRPCNLGKSASSRGTPMCQQSRAQVRPLWPHAATCLISSYSTSLCQRKVRNDPVLRGGVAHRPGLPIVVLLSTFPSLASSGPQQQPEALETSQKLGISAIYKPPPPQTAAIEASQTLRSCRGISACANHGKG